MIAKIIIFIWIILKNIPNLKGITFYVLRNSRYFLQRFRGRKPALPGPSNLNFLKEVSAQIGDWRLVIVVLVEIEN